MFKRAMVGRSTTWITSTSPSRASETSSNSPVANRSRAAAASCCSSTRSLALTGNALKTEAAETRCSPSTRMSETSKDCAWAPLAPTSKSAAIPRVLIFMQSIRSRWSARRLRQAPYTFVQADDKASCALHALLPQAHQIKIERHQHQGANHGKSDAQPYRLCLLRYRPPTYDLDKIVKQMTAVEHGNGQQIQYT